MTRTLVIFLLIFSLLSCGNEEDLGGFGSKKDYNLGSIEPILLSEYPREIDSVIALKLDDHYTTQFNFKSLVSYGVKVEKKKDLQISYIDSSNYDVFVEVSHNKIKDNWYFFLNKKLELLYFEKK